MRSHTIPKKLLEQFAYYDPDTRSLRLWRYSANIRPIGKISPRSATRFSGHFSDPRNPEKERALEERLNDDFETPVHSFLELFKYSTFVPAYKQIRQLTSYITLLFNRSRARRAATAEQIKIIIDSANTLLSNRNQLALIAANWTARIILSDKVIHRPVSIIDVRNAIEQMIEEQRSNDALQHSYVGTIERAMENMDETMASGIWNILRSEIGNPFVLGDAPIVTWIRTEDGRLEYGHGFEKPNVEVIFPVNSTACLHILPNVNRTRITRIPSIEDVNAAQASFATSACYTCTESTALNEILQPRFGKAQLLVNAFSLKHRDFSNTMFELLMNRPFSAPNL